MVIYTPVSSLKLYGYRKIPIKTSFFDQKPKPTYSYFIDFLLK